MKALFRQSVRLPSSSAFLHTNYVRARLTRTSPFIRLPCTNMSFFEDAVKKLDNLSQEVGKHATNAVAGVNKHIPSTLQTLQNFGEDAGKHVGATADDVWKALLSAGNGIGKHARPAAEDVWKKLEVLGQETGKRVGGVVDDAKKFEWEGAAGDAKSWIEKHPKQAAGIAAGILAPPLAIAAVPLVLGGLGFTAVGVAASSIASGAQAIIGNVAPGGLFSILQGAAMGGGSVALVNGVVGGTVAVAAVGANIPGIVEAVNEGKAEEEAEKEAEEEDEEKKSKQ